MATKIIVSNRLSQEERRRAVKRALRVLLAKLKERRRSEEGRKEKVAA